MCSYVNTKRNITKDCVTCEHLKGQPGGADAFENDPSFRSRGTVYFIKAMLIHVMIPTSSYCSTGVCVI
jgi:hypothetical protein